MQCEESFGRRVFRSHRATVANHRPRALPLLAFETDRRVGFFVEKVRGRGESAGKPDGTIVDSVEIVLGHRFMAAQRRRAQRPDDCGRVAGYTNRQFLAFCDGSITPETALTLLLQFA